VVHASDVLRYLTLWKYGGTYLDMDFVIRKWVHNIRLQTSAICPSLFETYLNRYILLDIVNGPRPGHLKFKLGRGRGRGQEQWQGQGRNPFRVALGLNLPSIKCRYWLWILKLTLGVVCAGEGRPSTASDQSC
jgi:hypothetical protein